MKRFRLAITIGLLAAGSDAVFGLNKVLKDCDQNGSGQIETEELDRCLLRARNPTVKDLDRDKDGLLSDAEIDEYLGIQRTGLEAKYGSPPYSFDQIEQFLGLKPKRPLGGLLIRRSHETITLSDKPKSFKKAKGALFAFSNDAINETSTWQVRGALMKIFRLDKKPGDGKRRAPGHLSGVGLIPSLSFERVGAEKDSQDEVGDDDKAEEPDSLVGRIRLDIEFAGLHFNLQNYRFSVAYASDFSLDSRVLALELDWQPTHPRAGLGAYRNIGSSGSPLQFRWRLLVHSEYGEVLDPGEKANLVEDERFFRLGPKLGLELRPTAYRRLTLAIAWDYLYGLTGEPEQIDLFQAGLTVQFDSNGHFSFELSYQNGQLPLTLEDTDLFSTGIGVKF